MQEIHSSLVEQNRVVVRHQKYIEDVKQMQDQRIVLDVGGMRFETQRSVLTSSRAHDSMLFALGSDFDSDCCISCCF